MLESITHALIDRLQVFGGDGIEVLVRRMPGSISHLQLLTNRGILVCVQAEYVDRTSEWCSPTSSHPAYTTRSR